MGDLRPSAGFVVQTAGLVAAVASGSVLVPAWGVLGTVAVLSAGKSIATLLQVGLFVRYSGEPS